MPRRPVLDRGGRGATLWRAAVVRRVKAMDRGRIHSVSRMLGIGVERRVFHIKIRDSLTVMDSRFRGNDVIRVKYVTLTTAVIPAIVVIPAEAGIHLLSQGVMNPET